MSTQDFDALSDFAVLREMSISETAFGTARAGRSPRRRAAAAGRLRVCFPYLAQLHQTPHSLPIAVQLALRHPQVEVRIAALTKRHLAFAQRYARQCGATNLAYDLLRLPKVMRAEAADGGVQTGRKVFALVGNLAYFNGFDALVTPECTSLLLKRLGVRRPKFVWTSHGAGDRAVGFRKEIAQFDFALLAGAKLERRLRDGGLIRPGGYVTGVYAKFDYVQTAAAARRRLFDNDRPTVLYNPHFSPTLSSWPSVGRQVLDQFAADTAWNLVFAPHVRLFDGASDHKTAELAAYGRLPNIHVDLGSEASVDMTYTTGCDVYLGDVSSQAAEFMLRPRPCVFLNPRRTPWRHDENYAVWAMGEVLEDVAGLMAALDQAVARQPERRAMQQAYVQDTFGAGGGSTADVGADALADFLARTVAPRRLAAAA